MSIRWTGGTELTKPLECQQGSAFHAGGLRSCRLNPQREYEAEVLRQCAGRHDGAHDLSHLRRVWRNCKRIVELDCLTCDKEVLDKSMMWN